MIVVNMPGGAVQNVEECELLWLRKAFDSEWKGATMLQLANDRIYSVEPVSGLVKKLDGAKVRVAELSAPDATLKLTVCAQRVRQVIASDPAVYHAKAKSVLIFAGRMQLAVRETPDVARGLLGEADVA